MNLLEFPEAKSVVVCGDIHGDFNVLVHKMCVQYQMTDTLLIVAGDCGFGFERKGYYENIVRRGSNAKRMNQANNWIVFIRGNHDNPAYFDGKEFNHKRFKGIPDYTVIQACGHNILCIGGAISIDRQYRIAKQIKANRFRKTSTDIIAPAYYWPAEAPCFDEGKLDEITSVLKLDTVITHTAPSFCELISKNGLESFADHDPNLMEEVNAERAAMDAIHHKLKADGHPISRWYYGHFHQSWLSEIDGTLFKMLDILEFNELRPH